MDSITYEDIEFLKEILHVDKVSDVSEEKINRTYNALCEQEDDGDRNAREYLDFLDRILDNDFGVLYDKIYQIQVRQTRRIVLHCIYDIVLVGLTIFMILYEPEGQSDTSTSLATESTGYTQSMKNK